MKSSLFIYYFVNLSLHFYIKKKSVKVETQIHSKQKMKYEETAGCSNLCSQVNMDATHNCVRDSI